MTGFRWWASRRGVVIPAAGAGKLKTTIQNVFIGAVILWFAFRDARKPMGWEHSRYADWWNQFHGGFVALALAALLTVSSFAQYSTGTAGSLAPADGRVPYRSHPSARSRHP
jgi:phosphatidylglycerophosphate synthase